MDTYRQLTLKNKNILDDIERNVELARVGINKIEHNVKGKQITRKWVMVFLLFGAWTLFQLVLTQYKNDFLVVITVFSIIFGVVYYVYKPLIAKLRINGYRQLVHDLTPEFEGVVSAMRTQITDLARENLAFESIYSINEDRIDLNQDFADADLAQKQVYVYIVKALDVDADIALAAAKFTMHVLTKTPFHEL
jgi:hypothetical protein